jgi:KUP system potassium uptake protein
MIGCATLISDGFITPAISVSSAIEGLRIYNEEIPTVQIVIAILIGLFFFQQFGTGVVGKTFGPIMSLWFTVIGTLGTIQLVTNPGVLEAINPVYAVKLLVMYPGGFWILGAVFLCTTGAEALYSDLGHCGKENIRVGWGFVKVCLLLNYFGQAAWLLNHEGNTIEGLGGKAPFYAIMPEWFLPYGIGIATLAAIIASQALISGTFTLVNEAMKLKLWPMIRVRYPSQLKGQIYIPSINWILMTGCILVVLIFRESSAMEGAYGLAITFDMLMTTSLLVYYFSLYKKSTLRSLALALCPVVEQNLGNLPNVVPDAPLVGPDDCHRGAVEQIVRGVRRSASAHSAFVDGQQVAVAIEDPRVVAGRRGLGGSCYRQTSSTRLRPQFVHPAEAPMKADAVR